MNTDVYSLRLTRPGIEPGSTVSVADALSIQAMLVLFLINFSRLVPILKYNGLIMILGLLCSFSGVFSLSFVCFSDSHLRLSKITASQVFFNGIDACDSLFCG